MRRYILPTVCTSVRSHHLFKLIHNQKGKVLLLMNASVAFIVMISVCSEAEGGGDR